MILKVLKSGEFEPNGMIGRECLEGLPQVLADRGQNDFREASSGLDPHREFGGGSAAAGVIIGNYPDLPAFQGAEKRRSSGMVRGNPCDDPRPDVAL